MHWTNNVWFVLMIQVHVTVADVSVIIQMEMDLFMANFVSVMIENAQMMKQKKYVEVCILTAKINKVLDFSLV